MIDKSKWGDGPWQTEPDREEWRDADTGLPCLAVRQENSGHWCGYVAVAPGHPAHGKDYNDVDVTAHGGLTYGEACSGAVCHVPAPGEPDDVFWFGFDCAHYGDSCPAHDSRYADWKDPSSYYKTLDYVKRECAALAAQLAAMRP